MASSPRRGRAAPRLTMPGLVRLNVPPIPWDATRRGREIVPEWTVVGMLLLRGCVNSGPRLLAGVPITEPLDVLVVPPAGWVSFRAGYEHRGVWTTFCVPHYAATQVEPERHDPSAGRFCPTLYPTIRFEEPTSGPA